MMSFPKGMQIGGVARVMNQTFATSSPQRSEDLNIFNLDTPRMRAD